MTKLKREELLEWIDKCWGIVRCSWDDLELADQAYQQIKELLQKPDMTIKFSSGDTVGISIGVGAEDLARTFHRVYEKLAPKYGYKTKRKTRKDWHNLPENNKKLMIAVAQVILNKYSKKPEVTEEWIEEKALECQGIYNPDKAKDFIRSLVEEIRT